MKLLTFSLYLNNLLNIFTRILTVEIYLKIKLISYLFKLILNLYHIYLNTLKYELKGIIRKT